MSGLRLAPFKFETGDTGNVYRLITNKSRYIYLNMYEYIIYIALNLVKKHYARNHDTYIYSKQLSIFTYIYSVKITRRK